MASPVAVRPALRPVQRQAAKLVDVDLESALLSPRLAPAKSDTRGRLKLAILLALTGMVWATVAQSEASQALQQRGQFNKPFFIVCFNHTLTGLLVPLTFAYFKLFGTKTDKYEASWLDPMATLRRHSVLPAHRLLSVAGFFSVFFLFVDYFWYAALPGVSVTVATAVGNSTPLFVYCFSICFLRERVTLKKVGGVLLAFIGVTLVLLFQNFDVSTLKNQSVVAGLLIVVSSALCAAYDVAFKYILGELTDTATVLIITGLSGVLTIPLWIIGGILLAHSPIASLHEPFSWPETGEAVWLLFLSGSLAVLINVCTPLLLCWTSPLETSVARMLVVPLSGVWDVVVHHTLFSNECVLGSMLVLLGFGVLEYSPQKKTDAESTTKPKSHAHVYVLQPAA